MSTTSAELMLPPPDYGPPIPASQEQITQLSKSILRQIAVARREKREDLVTSLTQEYYDVIRGVISR